MDKIDVLQTLITRGESYNVADTLIARAKFPNKELQCRDGENYLPKLDFLKGETFDIEQNNLPEEEEKVSFEPLSYQPQAPKNHEELLTLQAPSFDDIGTYPAVKQVDASSYKKQDSEELLEKSKKLLLFSQLLNVNPKPFSLRLSTQFKFETRFEGGNLFAALHEKNVFDFLIRPDFGTANHTLCFGFAMQGLKAGKYVFRFQNVLKRIDNPFEPIMYDGQQYCRVGNDIACYEGNFERRTVYFYEDARETLRMSANGARVEEMPEFKQNETYFKGMLRKQGLVEKSGKLKKGVEIAYEAPGRYYAYVLEIALDRDYETLYFFSHLEINYLHLLKRLAGLQKSAESVPNVEIRHLSFCRTYAGNQVPFLQVFQHTEKDKKAFVVLARTAPEDSASSLVALGFLNDLLGRYDREYESAIDAADDKAANMLKAAYNKHKNYRQQLLNRYVFYFLPMYAVDGAIIGNTRTDCFGFNLQREFDQPGGYKTPQQIAFRQMFGEGKIDFLLDLRAAENTKKWRIDMCLNKSYQPLQNKAWDSLARIGVVPKMSQEALQRMFSSSKSAQLKAFLTEQQGVKDELPYVDIDKKQVAEYLATEIREFSENDRDLFRIYALLAHCRRFPAFDFEGSTATRFQDDTESSNIRYCVNFAHKPAYTMYFPATGDESVEYNMQSYFEIGKEVFNAVEFLHNEPDIEAERLDLLDEYSRWVSAATLAKICKGDFVQVDVNRLEEIVRKSLPDTLVTYAQMTDKVRYAVLHDFNSRIDYRGALGISYETKAHFDSDDSVQDDELAVEAVKETDEEKERRMADMKLIHDLFEAEFPAPPKRKGKKGRKTKK